MCPIMLRVRLAKKFARNRKRWSKDGQREIVFGRPLTWGGKRKDAGRKKKGARAGTKHRRRAAFDGSRSPVQITLRVLPDVPSLRGEHLRKTIFDAIRRSNERGALAVTDFSILSNHMHLIVECAYRNALSRGMQGLMIRISKAINRALGRKGSVFADRFHS